LRGLCRVGDTPAFTPATGTLNGGIRVVQTHAIYWGYQGDVLTFQFLSYRNQCICFHRSCYGRGWNGVSVSWPPCGCYTLAPVHGRVLVLLNRAVLDAVKLNTLNSNNRDLCGSCRFFLPLPYDVKRQNLQIRGRFISLCSTPQLLEHACLVLPMNKCPTIGTKTWTRRRETPFMLGLRSHVALIDPNVPESAHLLRHGFAACYLV
jgi:hypothetical protein